MSEPEAGRLVIAPFRPGILDTLTTGIGRDSYALIKEAAVNSDKRKRRACEWLDPHQSWTTENLNSVARNGRRRVS